MLSAAAGAAGRDASKGSKRRPDKNGDCQEQPPLIFSNPKKLPAHVAFSAWSVSASNWAICRARSDLAAAWWLVAMTV